MNVAVQEGFQELVTMAVAGEVVGACNSGNPAEVAGSGNGGRLEGKPGAPALTMKA